LHYKADFNKKFEGLENGWDTLIKDII